MVHGKTRVGSLPTVSGFMGTVLGGRIKHLRSMAGLGKRSGQCRLAARMADGAQAGLLDECAASDEGGKAGAVTPQGFGQKVGLLAAGGAEPRALRDTSR
ncbi:hypothetical protein GCM10023213_07770 [Prosthecobacter algae]|uniref:Uncharacterized protein n=1 Tax=Prosthecobacter algae TaxID=1144682 RepID=A0ABP9NVQ8_9BACT